MEPTVNTPSSQALASAPTLAELMAAVVAVAETQAPKQIGYGEREIAAAFALSVARLRKDRLGKRLIPFWKIGKTVRYDLDRVREALKQFEVGGPRPKARKRSPRAEKLAA